MTDWPGLIYELAEMINEYLTADIDINVDEPYPYEEVQELVTLILANKKENTNE